MSTYAQKNSSALIPSDMLTIAEGATLLAVHEQTIRRWIRAGRLPAYRLGGKGLRMRREDLLHLVVPLGNAGSEEAEDLSRFAAPLTAEEQERGLRALARLKELHRASRKQLGESPSDSLEIIHRMREERDEQLLRAIEE